MSGSTLWLSVKNPNAPADYYVEQRLASQLINTRANQRLSEWIEAVSPGSITSTRKLSEADAITRSRVQGENSGSLLLLGFAGGLSPALTRGGGSRDGGGGGGGGGGSGFGSTRWRRSACVGSSMRIGLRKRPPYRPQAYPSTIINNDKSNNTRFADPAGC